MHYAALAVLAVTWFAGYSLALRNDIVCNLWAGIDVPTGCNPAVLKDCLPETCYDRKLGCVMYVEQVLWNAHNHVEPTIGRIVATHFEFF